MSFEDQFKSEFDNKEFMIWSTVSYLLYLHVYFKLLIFLNCTYVHGVVKSDTTEVT